jgi:hypothetical protein
MVVQIYQNTKMQSTIVINKCGKHFFNADMKRDGIGVENF